MHQTIDAIRWILALILGAAVVTSIVVPACFHRYDDHGIGTYNGVLGGRCFSESHVCILKFEGVSEPEWRMWPPSTYVYRSLELEMVTADHGALNGKLYLPEMRFVHGTGELDLTESRLSSLLLVTDLPKTASRNVIEDLHALLKSAGTGEFPSPQHHSREIVDDDSKFVATYGHWSTGRRVPHLLIYWILLWILALSVYILRRTKNIAAG